jgi:hypothetical protein
MSMNKNKKNELANLLRQLADFVENRSDAELVPLFEQAATLMPKEATRKKYQSPSNTPRPTEYFNQIVSQLRELSTREEGDVLLLEAKLRREGLETLARILQLPVQRDDSIERLRAKIVENVICSRLRSNAIQGGGVI